jgi:uncharacterized protein (TIGR02466 family)
MPTRSRKASPTLPSPHHRAPPPAFRPPPTARPAHRPHITYPAAAGNVILFESWLRHEVAANRVADERISISFNFNWS